MVTFSRRESRPCYWIASGQIKTLLPCCRVSTVAALQTVGAFLVICLVVTPGATAWLLTVVFPPAHDCCNYWQCNQFLDAWRYFLDGGGIVVAQTLLFLLAFGLCAHPWAFGNSSACA